MSLPAPAWVLVLRPQPGADATLSALTAAGLCGVASPLFTIEPVAWQPPDPRDFDAVLAGSANVFRHGGAVLKSLIHLPALVVGRATAQAARAAGFDVRQQGSGGLQMLLDRLDLSRPARLLRLAGEAHVPLAAPLGVTIETVITYQARPKRLADEAIAVLKSGMAIALLHSGEAAVCFAQEVDRLGLDRARITLVCLAPRIADLAGDGWAAKQVADAPCDASLVALTGQICQKPGCNSA